MSKARGPYRVDPLGYKKANEALDKKAENARQVGLNYEPAQCKYPKCSYPCTDLPDCRDAEQPAQQALDKKAENARELGLDYEPAQQEPVAYIHRQGNHYEVSERFLSDDEKSRGWTEEPLYTPPPAQRTWAGLTEQEALDCFSPNPVTHSKNVEAKLKEKNT
jgi:hypothetical protein